MITEALGIPLAVSLTGGNRNDVTQLMPLIEAIPPVRGRRGPPRRRPEKVYAAAGCDSSWSTCRSAGSSAAANSGCFSRSNLRSIPYSAAPARWWP